MQGEDSNMDQCPNTTLDGLINASLDTHTAALARAAQAVDVDGVDDPDLIRAAAGFAIGFRAALVSGAVDTPGLAVLLSTVVKSIGMIDTYMMGGGRTELENGRNELVLLVNSSRQAVRAAMHQRHIEVFGEEVAAALGKDAPSDDDSVALGAYFYAVRPSVFAGFALNHGKQMRCKCAACYGAAAPVDTKLPVVTKKSVEEFGSMDAVLAAYGRMWHKSLQDLSNLHMDIAPLADGIDADHAKGLADSFLSSMGVKGAKS